MDRIAELLEEVEARSNEKHLEIDKRYRRYEDMSATGFLELVQQEDGDVCLLMGGRDSSDRFTLASLEFCVPGTGGGQSTHTLKALRGLALAMEKDNEERTQYRGTG